MGGEPVRMNFGIRAGIKKPNKEKTENRGRQDSRRTDSPIPNSTEINRTW